MAQRHLNSYDELEQAFEEFPPKERVTTHLVFGAGMTPAAVMMELVMLSLGAKALNVLVTTFYDEIENSAFVSLNGQAGDAANLAAFMATEEVASAS